MSLSDSPQISADGKLLLYRGTLVCTAGSSCFLSEQHSTTLRDRTSGAESAVGPNARMSSNGRYLAVHTSGNTFFRQFTFTDLATSTTLLKLSEYWDASIANDGTMLMYSPSRMQLWKAGVTTTLAAPSAITAAFISDNAKVAIYETQSAKGRRLFIIDLATLRATQLGPDDRDSFHATLSSDGQHVLYLTTLGAITQVFFSRIDGSEWKQLTATGAGATDCTLSGDATTAYAAGADGSLLRIDTTTGTTTTLIGATPTVTTADQVTPGSLATATGTGLGEASLKFGDTEMLILNRTDQSITFQVPWETPVGTGALTIPEGGAPYFEDSVPYELPFFAPHAVPLGDAQNGERPVAIHADFQSLVTPDNPAQPGEVVHYYLTGGGPVSPAVATGALGPTSPLAWITTPINAVDSANNAVRVLYFGLAPGLVGLWQLDVVVPPNWSRQYFGLEIQYNSQGPTPFGESMFLDAIPVSHSTT